MTGSQQAMMGGGSGLSVSLSTTVASYIGKVTLGGAVYSHTNTVSGTISGGTAPYVSSWAITTSDGITAYNPASPSTAFYKTGAAIGVTYTGTAILTVTDSLGATAQSATVTVTLKRTS